MAKLILGLAGEMGSGKGTTAEYFVQKYEGKTHRFSTMLRDILDRLYLPQSRENMQKLSTELRATFGEELLAKVMTDDVKLDAVDLIIIDGIRRTADIKYLRELSHFKLIYIETDIEKRYERIHTRSENADDTNKTFEQFSKDQEDESESQIKELKGVTDFLVNNNGSFEELYNQIEEIIKSLDYDNWRRSELLHIRKSD
jgi:dephospho-CoA kinase